MGPTSGWRWAFACFLVACSEAPPPVDGGGSDAPALDAPTAPDSPSPDGGSCATADRDGDGHDGIACGGADCDDDDPLVSPGEMEVCDAADRDEDCDPMTFGDRDVDRDGFVDALCCNQDGPTLRCGDDCNDRARGTTPIATETCNHVDDDCNGGIDEGVETDGFVDSDRDLHGDGAMPLTGCAGDPGLSPVGDDCDDDDALTHGAQHEVCNGLDDDCDGDIDEGAGAIAWWPDIDLDGFGDPDGTSISSCTPVPDHRLLATDCDDADPAVSPGATETCDGTDEDCSGVADFEVAPGDLEDDDRDGSPDAACAPAGTGDCDDRDPSVHPGAAEIADGIDNDCDGTTDATCEMTSWWPDGDGDGWGDGSMAMTRACDPPAGHVTRAGDCDDADPDRSPALRDACNAIDDDCDDLVDEDSSRYCVVPHALPLCTAGACGIGLCERHYDDCDPARAGCETDTRVSALHCGVCGTRCESGPRSLPVCALATCDLTCTSGFDDCDGVATTGCEVDVRFDELNCGSCDLRCSARANAAPDCTDGSCGVACNPGFADCDGAVANGCEISTARDRAHCGGCGAACPIAGDVCIAGACIAPTFPSTGALGDFRPTADVRLPAGRHDYASIFIPTGVTVRVEGAGVLDLRATGDVVIEGTIDVSGGRGGDGLNGCWMSGNGGGGATADPLGIGVNGMNGVCAPGGTGGGGTFGSPGSGCGPAGDRGGGAGGANCGNGGGGGGGFAGGGGGAGGYLGWLSGGGGASIAPASGGTGGATDRAGGRGGESGGTLGPYAGLDGSAGTCDTSGSGGGGSIGAVAAADLAVATAFQTGSGGGGGGGICVDCTRAWAHSGFGGGGGGGGGALRIASMTAIRIPGVVRADGGRGGNASGGGAAGGGGSGGVVYLSAPSIEVDGIVSAAGGAGGTVAGCMDTGGRGGMGRVRVSVLAEECRLGGTWTPALAAGCAPSMVSGTAYVATYPD